MFDRNDTALAVGTFVLKSGQKMLLRSLADGVRVGEFVAPYAVGRTEGVCVGGSVGIIEVVG